jgi:hypothetical protein
MKRKRQKKGDVAESSFSFKNISTYLMADLILPFLKLEEMQTLIEAFQCNQHLHKNYIKKVFQGCKINPKVGLDISGPSQVSFMKKYGISSRNLRVNLSSDPNEDVDWFFRKDYYIDGPTFRKLIGTCTESLEVLKLRYCKDAARLDCVSSILISHLLELKELTVQVDNFDMLMGNGRHYMEDYLGDPSLLRELITNSGSLRKLVIECKSCRSIEDMEVFSALDGATNEFRIKCVAKALAVNSNLEYVRLVNVPYGETLFNALQGLRSTLRHLFLPSCRVPESSSFNVQPLVITERLETLDLRDIEGSNFDTNAAIIRSCGGGLKNLCFAHRSESQVNSQCMHLLSTCCPHLEILDISVGGSHLTYHSETPRPTWGQLTDEDFELLAQGCKKLKVIKFHRHYRITERTIEALLLHCPLIQEIHTHYTSIPKPGNYFTAKERELATEGRKVTLEWIHERDPVYDFLFS